MKYMLLIYHEEQAWGRLSEQERQKIYAEYGQFTQEIMASGHHLGGFELHPVATATSVRYAMVNNLRPMARSQRPRSSLGATT